MVIEGARSQGCYWPLFRTLALFSSPADHGRRVESRDEGESRVRRTLIVSLMAMVSGSYEYYEQCMRTRLSVLPTPRKAGMRSEMPQTAPGLSIKDEVISGLRLGSTYAGTRDVRDSWETSNENVA